MRVLQTDEMEIGYWSCWSDEEGLMIHPDSKSLHLRIELEDYVKIYMESDVPIFL
jgi:hypothetical protein